ncbi:MAG: hypothetical protein QF357_11735 [Dehalococcoidia bacterium]|nr:hypothetical protein [Dehalococcoidia bacterium]
MPENTDTPPTNQTKTHGPEMYDRNSDNTTDLLTLSTELSRAAIRWRLAADAAGHPVSTLAMGAFVLSGIYLLLLTPLLGGESLATTALGVSVTLAIVNFTYRYRKEYASTVRHLEKARKEEWTRLQDAGLRLRHQSLREGFSAIGHAEGVNALESLTDEYGRLQPSLNNENDLDLISGPQVGELTDETYRRGISVLADALTLVEAIQTPGVDEIEREITALESEIEALSEVGGEHGGQAGRLEIKQNLLGLQRQRLAEMSHTQVSVDELIYQSHRCEVSLHHTRIELAAIRAGSRRSAVSSVIGALEGTIRRAKEVQQELKNLGF